MSSKQIFFCALLITGTFGLGRWQSIANAGGAVSRPAVERTILYYKCPMHPLTRSDKPGVAADCGMDMVPVYQDTASPARTQEMLAGLGPGAVRISSEKQQLIGVRLGTVKEFQGASTFRTSGRIVPDEASIYRLTAKTDGWIREIFPDSTGSFVRKGQPLLSVYSRDLQTAQQGYVFSLVQLDRFRNGDEPDALARLNLAIRDARLNLESMGMSTDQIETVARTKKVLPAVTLVAPASGFIVSRAVYADQRFDKGADFYHIVDLRRVWILADVFELDAPGIKAGALARLSVPQMPKTQGAEWKARVSQALPQFDASTRTLKVRLEANNPGFALKPDMSVDLEFSTQMPSALVVPQDAIVDSGLRKVVYVDRGEGCFEARQVQTGWHSGDRVEVVKGLSAGERIVVSGNFLIDSESRLQAGVSRHD
jgi:Cu(I)/Ag(I) efflux system membrane fusion protein